MQKSSPADIDAQLTRILDSPQFRDSPRLQTLLRFVVSLTLAGKAHEIKESIIASDVFGRDDTSGDSIVRSAARRLRARLDDYYDQAGVSDPVRIFIPKGSYVPEIEERPDKREIIQAPALQNVAIDAQPATPVRRRMLLYVAALALCAAGAWLGGRFLRNIRAPQPGNPASVAVLPFANRSADPANQYLADGLTAEITDLLARNERVHVAARSSVSQFKAKPADLGDLGRRLKVSSVLEGSVERSGDRVKIICRLERASDGASVWSNTYECAASRLFAVESELAAGVAAKLAGGAAIPVLRHIPNPAAHDFVMKGRLDLQQATTQAVAQAEADFQHAISLDPDYGVAYLWLARANLAQAPARGSVYRTELERDNAEELSRKALQIDPNLPEAHAVLADLAMEYDWDWSKAERELLEALTGPPSAQTELTYAFFLIVHRRFADAEPHLIRAQDLEPFDTSTMLYMAQDRYLESRFAEAREIAQRLLALHPMLLAAQIEVAASPIWEGKPELALARFERIQKPFPTLPFYQAMARARAGQREKALRLIRPYEERYPNCGVALQWIAKVYAMLGDEPNTIKWLERSVDRRERQALNIAVNPVFAPMENSPGFRALKKRMGLEQ